MDDDLATDGDRGVVAGDLDFSLPRDEVAGATDPLLTDVLRGGKLMTESVSYVLKK